MAKRVIHCWQDIQDRIDCFGPINNKTKFGRGYISLCHHDWIGNRKRKVHRICSEHEYVYLSAHKDFYLDDEHVIDHINNIPDDNRLENLQVLTIKENNEKRRNTDNNPKDIDRLNFLAQKRTFTDDQVREIRKKYDSCVPQVALVREYKTTAKIISLIVRRKSYRFVE